MKIQKLAVVTAVSLAVAFAGPAFAGEKTEGKSDKAKETTYTVPCETPCDFTVKSHDKKEVVTVVKAHAKSHHNMDMADKEIEAMIKTHGPVAKKS
jgi:predicted small metal-binding protein